MLNRLRIHYPRTMNACEFTAELVLILAMLATYLILAGALKEAQ